MVDSVIEYLEGYIRESIPKGKVDAVYKGLRYFTEMLSIVLDKTGIIQDEEETNEILYGTGYTFIDISKNVFELEDIDNDYERIVKELASSLQEEVFELINKVPTIEDLVSGLNSSLYFVYSKKLKEIGRESLNQIKDEDLSRKNSYFWQQIFIKYTPDCKRIFYPNVFSDGYLLSEEQFQNYIKYGNKFFIILICALVFMVKFKILKAIVVFKLIQFTGIQSVLAVFGILFILGCLYNAISSKIIFKDAIKIKEKFWTNNQQNANILKNLFLQFSCFWAFLIVFVAFAIHQEASVGIPCIVFAAIAIFVYLRKFRKQLRGFVNGQEKQALFSYAEYELRNQDRNNLIPHITQNAREYLKDYIDYLYKTSEMGYIEITKCIRYFIRSFIRFDKKLYEQNIPASEHEKLIERRFLSHFEYV